MNDFNSRKCIFVYNITDNSFKTDMDIKQLITKELFLKQEHFLFIYIRYDNEINSSQYKDKCRKFMKIMKNSFDNIDIIEYCRYYDKYGLWGNISRYTTDFKKLLKLV